MCERCCLCRESSTYQSIHGAVESMSVIASELGVGSLQGRVTVGLGLLDTELRRKRLVIRRLDS
jgi:hypothetical protein